MMNKDFMTTNQKIFRSSYVSQLRADLKSGVSLKDYFSKKFSSPDNSVMETSVKVKLDGLNLKIPASGNQADADFENAIKVYEAYRELTETQASDPRLWTYLSHCTFRKYVMKRWNMGKSHNEAVSSQSMANSATNFILSHWFVGGNDRSLRRNAIARLWWATYLTVSPWEKDPEYFSGTDVEKEDSYKYTKILFSTQDVFQQVLERGIGRNSRILISSLEYIGKHSPLTRKQIRDVMKELNLTSSIQNIAVLSKDELSALIEEIVAIEEPALKI